MTTKKKLLSYNTIKHPLVAQFFDELEDTNLASHYVRKAIEFYQQHENTQQLRIEQAKITEEQNKKVDDSEWSYFDAKLWYLSNYGS